MIITLKKNGITKRVKCGFSWTTFFFPGIVQLIRGEFLMGILLLIFDLPTFFVFGIVWSFIGNRYTARKLVENGFVVQDQDQAYVKHALMKWGIEQ